MIWLYGVSLFIIALVTSVVVGKILVAVIQRGFNGMTLESGFTNCPLDAEGCFAIILLATCEITKNLLIDRNQKNQKRMFWLKELDKAIEGVNKCYKGYLPDEVHENAMEFHTKIEVAINTLLSQLKTPHTKCESCGKIQYPLNVIQNTKTKELKACCNSCLHYLPFNPDWIEISFSATTTKKED